MGSVHVVYVSRSGKGEREGRIIKKERGVERAEWKSFNKPKDRIEVWPPPQQHMAE